VPREYESVDVRIGDAGIAKITLDQPETRNALSDAVVRDLIAAFTRVRDGDEVRCVILGSSHPKTFSAGGNLSGMAAEVPLAQKHEANGRFPELFKLIGELASRSSAPWEGIASRGRSAWRWPAT